MKTPPVITVAKNGAVKLNGNHIALQTLPNSLKAIGFTAGSKLTVQGEEGANPQDIDRVLELLVVNGLLPKDTID